MRVVARTCALVAFAALVVAPAAAAGEPPGIAQYVETLPSAAGGKSGVDTTGTKLPAKIQAKLAARGGHAARSLRIIATSGAFGAPTEKHKLTTRPPAESTTRNHTVASGDSGAVQATGGGRAAPIGLIVVLVLLTAAIAAAAWRRRSASA
jgi:hypothetical protein